MKISPHITSIRFSSAPERKPALKTGTTKFFKGTGHKKGWYILKHEKYHNFRGEPLGYVSNGRGGLRTEWVKMDPQPEAPVNVSSS
jgi:hypothetical protein